MRGQHLHGDCPIEPRIAGAIDFAHAAGADQVQDFVVAELLAGHRVALSYSISIESKSGGNTVNLDKIFKTIDVLLGVREITKDKPNPDQTDTSSVASSAAGFGNQIEKTLTNVLVAALKEAFDRDHARLELERAHVEDQKRRAEEALRVELRRQAMERELSRLRLLTATAVVGWIVAVLLLVLRLGHISGASIALMGGGCLLLLGSLGSAFMAQSRVDAVMSQVDVSQPQAPSGAVALWLLLGGLALSAASLLFK